MKAEKFSIKSAGFNIVCLFKESRKRLSNNPVVIMLHGSTNTKDDAPMYPEIAQGLVESGINAFRFDFFGSGESDGLYREKTMAIMDQNLEDIIDYVYGGMKFKLVGLFGRSLSAAQSLYFNDPRIKVRVVHSAASHLYDDLLGLYPQEVREMYEKNLDEALIASDPRKVKGPYAYSRTIVEEFKKVPDRIKKNLSKISHISIFQGDADPETTVDEALEIYETVQAPKELHLFSGAGHRYVGLEREVTELTISWFVRQFTDLKRSFTS